MIEERYQRHGLIFPMTAYWEAIAKSDFKTRFTKGFYFKTRCGAYQIQPGIVSAVDTFSVQLDDSVQPGSDRVER